MNLSKREGIDNGQNWIHASSKTTSHVLSTMTILDEGTFL